MKNKGLVIMAGGASSRMKRSLSGSGLNDEVLKAAQSAHKSLIPLDQKGRPLLYYLLRNAQKAGYRYIYIITSEKNDAFKQFLKSFEDEVLQKLEIKFAIQFVPKNRNKPLGTADALLQCLEQHPNLVDERFTVCNGDNLYSSNVMQLLKQDRKSLHATIAYIGAGLGFDDEKLSKFAVMQLDGTGYLKQIIEKPKISEMNRFQNDSGELLISMNIFSFSGDGIYPFLKNCPLHPLRDEKELPQAVRMAVADSPGCMACFEVNETIPDLTTAEDIKSINSYL